MGGVIGGNHQGIKCLKTPSASVGRALLYISAVFPPPARSVRIESGNKNVAGIALHVGTSLLHAASTQSLNLESS